VLHQGETTRAIALFQESVTLFNQQEITVGVASCLVGFASLAGARGELTRAARLLGAVTSMLEAADLRFAPADQKAYEQSRAALNHAEAEEYVEDAWRMGHQLTPESAVAETLTFADTRQSVLRSGPVPMAEQRAGK
jgi:hypothetical protein